MADFKYDFDEQAYWEYRDEVDASQGFYVMSKYGPKVWCGIGRISEEDFGFFVKAEVAARFAVDEYNKKEINANLNFMKILNLNHEPAAGSIFYITLEAKDSSNEVKHYQAKVWAKINSGFKVEIFRLAPYAAKTPECPRDYSSCIRIKNLQPWMDENYIYYKCFYRAKELLSVKVIRNEQSGQTQGHGFLQFKSVSAAEKILMAYDQTLMPCTKQRYKLERANEI